MVLHCAQAVLLQCMSPLKRGFPAWFAQVRTGASKKRPPGQGIFSAARGLPLRHATVTAWRHTVNVSAVMPSPDSLVSLWLFQGYFIAAPWGGFFCDQRHPQPLSKAELLVRMHLATQMFLIMKRKTNAHKQLTNNEQQPMPVNNTGNKLVHKPVKAVQPG